MWNEEKIQLEKKEIMKKKIKIFQQLVQNYGSEKTIEYFKTFIDNENLMNLAISKIEPFKDQSKEFKRLFDRLKQVYQEKLYKLSSERNGKVK